MMASPQTQYEIAFLFDDRAARAEGVLERLELPRLIGTGRALQLLTHPFWWQAPALPPAERLRRFLAERAELLDRELARHCSVHVSR